MNKHDNFATTGWKAEGSSEGSAASDGIIKQINQLQVGMVRENSFDAPGGMGKVYHTTEHSTLKELEPGKKIVVESYVTTKAPYGDRFHVMLQHSMVALDKKSTRFTVHFTIVYMASVNGMIKGMIEKGSKEGMKKSQENAATCLMGLAKVSPYGGPEAVVEPEKKSYAIINKKHLQIVFGGRVVAVLEPWACLAHDFLGHIPGLKVITPTRILLLTLTMLTVETTRVFLGILHVLQRGSEVTSGTPVSHALYYLFKYIHVPTNVGEVVSTFLLLLLVRFVLGIFTLILPNPKEEGEGEQKDAVYGVKYDGYRNAMNNVSAQYVGIDARSEFALEQIGKGMDYIANKFKKSKKPKPLEGKTKALGARLKMHHQHHKEKHTAKKLAHACKAKAHSSDDDDSVAAKSLVTLDPVEYKPPAIAEIAPDNTIVEEIFENERQQPFRGFGSTWPGHFLPTDRVHRWNVRKANSSGIYSSQNMATVAPVLPEGWVWVEDAWSLDLSGTPSGTTDSNGWSYALDFPSNIQYPFPPGTGKKKMSDFVRTRRWLRTRVLEEALAQTSLSQDQPSVTSQDEIQEEMSRDTSSHQLLT